jgi:hypothetical protein
MWEMGNSVHCYGNMKEGAQFRDLGVDWKMIV